MANTENNKFLMEVRDLMEDNEMMSHIFLGCMDRPTLMKIKESYMDDIDWRKDSVKLPVEMKIAGYDVNPKEFFDTWRDQMNSMIKKEAHRLVSEKIKGSKIVDITSKLMEFEEIIDSWTSDINWEIDNPLK